MNPSNESLEATINIIQPCRKPKSLSPPGHIGTSFRWSSGDLWRFLPTPLRSGRRWECLVETTVPLKNPENTSWQFLNVGVWTGFQFPWDLCSAGLINSESLKYDLLSGSETIMIQHSTVFWTTEHGWMNHDPNASAKPPKPGICGLD